MLCTVLHASYVIRKLLVFPCLLYIHVVLIMLLLVVNCQVVDAVQAVKATSERGDVKYPIKVSQLILLELVYPMHYLILQACATCLLNVATVVGVEMMIVAVSLCIY